MERIVQKLEAEVARKREHGKEFLGQIERYKRFKDEMQRAGVAYGDTYSIPLMSRLGHAARTK